MKGCSEVSISLVHSVPKSAPKFHGQKYLQFKEVILTLKDVSVKLNKEERPRRKHPMIKIMLDHAHDFSCSS